MLRRLLARADQSPGGEEGESERLFAFFGITSAAGRDLPVAAVTRVADMGVIDREWWIRADPVYLEAGRDSLVMRAGLGLSPEEARQLVKELNESLVQDGWLLKAPHPDRWYLKPPSAASITTTSLAAANGRNVRPLLPLGPDHKTWHTRLNELQILLHTSPVNVARASRGLVPVNSVWFWGGGQLPQPGPVEWVQVVSGDPLSLGLARLTSVPCSPVPDEASAMKLQSVSGAQLLVLRLPAPILSQDDAEAWLAAAQTLVEGQLASLLAAVHTGELNALTLVSDVGPQFRYCRAHRWRFWRRPRSLAAFRAD